jgi:hypothetical protein
MAHRARPGEAAEDQPQQPTQPRSGLTSPSLATALYYQEMLASTCHWRNVPVVAFQMEARCDPDAQSRKIRKYMRRRYNGDDAFKHRVMDFNKRGQLRKIQMVKEGKAYYTTSARGNPMIKIKPEFKTGRWPNAPQAR